MPLAAILVGYEHRKYRSKGRSQIFRRQIHGSAKAGCLYGATVTAAPRKGAKTARCCAEAHDHCVAQEVAGLLNRQGGRDLATVKLSW
jgi:hypothetical protein